MSSRLDALNQWVLQVARLTQPDRIHWCDGSDSEFATLTEQMEADGTLLPLNADTHPRSWLHRSHPDDVARVEHLTFVCTSERDDAGPNNHWMPPADGHAQMDELFDGCMRGRTMYVIPYCMGPIDSPLSRCGVEVTDSPYVVANMRIMTRMGAAALARIERDRRFVKGLHSIGELDPNRRFIMHFPEELTIKSYGSGYGGNALLGKKCHALRIASHQARSEGWLAEHMLILGIENPKGETHYIAAAFPSACGKTNLAMLIPAGRLSSRGLEDLDHRRRHLLDAPGAPTAACTRSTRRRVSSASRRARRRSPIRMRWRRSSTTRSSPMSVSPRTTSRGGKASTTARWR
jgi:phosphoenolpyruvate carboxykinase (GTP)